MTAEYRIARMEISRDLLAQLLNLPDDCKIVFAQSEFDRGAITVCIESPEFPENLLGQRYPRVTARYITRHYECGHETTEFTGWYIDG